MAPLVFLIALTFVSQATGCDLCQRGMPQDHSKDWGQTYSGWGPAQMNSGWGQGQMNTQQLEQMMMMQMWQQRQQQQQMMNWQGQQQGWNSWGSGNTGTNTQSTSNCQGFADVVFLLDSSSSVGAENFNKQLEFVSNLVSNFQLSSTGGRRDFQFGVVSFGDNVEENISLNSHRGKQELVQAIKDIEFMSQGTRTDLGLQYVKNMCFRSEKGGRAGAVKIVIVITDGQSNDPAQTEDEAEDVQKEGILVLAVGVGTDVNEEELNKIASGSENVFTVENFDLLDTLEEAVENRACQVTEEQGGRSNPHTWQDFLKWCAEQQEMKQKQETERNMLEQIKKREAEEKAKAEAVRMEREKVKHAKEELEAMSYKMEKMAEMMKEFDHYAVNRMELNHQYAFEATSQMVQFCPLGEYSDDVMMFLSHGDSQWRPAKPDQCNMDSMQEFSVDSDPAEIAQLIANEPKAKQIEYFFGGLKNAMCAGLIKYLDQLKAWLEQYPGFRAQVMPMM